MENKKKEREDLIPLQRAHVNQYTTSEGKSPWEVQENETNGLLATLPRDLTETQVFQVLHFARKFELLALNIGLTHSHRELIASWNLEKENLLFVIKGLETANTKLADKLAKYIGEE